MTTREISCTCGCVSVCIREYKVLVKYVVVVDVFWTVKFHGTAAMCLRDVRGNFVSGRVGARKSLNLFA